MTGVEKSFKSNELGRQEEERRIEKRHRKNGEKKRDGLRRDREWREGGDSPRERKRKG